MWRVFARVPCSELMRLFLLCFLGSVAVASLAFACSSASEPSPFSSQAEAGAPDAARPADDAQADARARVTPPPLPIIPNHGGPVVPSPEIITLTWTTDPIAGDLEAFDGWMVPSSFWKTVMAEWGVGPGTHGGSYRIPTAAPAVLDYADVKPLVEGLVTAGHIPPPNGSRIYTIYPPEGTKVTSFGTEGCTGFQAFHSSFAYAPGDAGADAGTALAIFAITPRCDATAAGMTPLDFTTWGQSHEVMEAASDPDGTRPAWVIRRQTPSTPELGENADLCTGHPMVVEGHMVTRNYSNVAAAKGERPCVPAPAGPMFGAFGDPGEVTIKPGTTLTTKVVAYAAADMPAFKLKAFTNNPDLKAALGASTANEGDELTLTITATGNYFENEGQNLVFLYAQSKDYLTRRAIIVHAR